MAEQAGAEVNKYAGPVVGPFAAASTRCADALNPVKNSWAIVTDIGKSAASARLAKKAVKESAFLGFKEVAKHVPVVTPFMCAGGVFRVPIAYG
jgi:hypothetical protein